MAEARPTDADHLRRRGRALPQPSLYLKRVLPNASLAMFAKTGHTVNIEEPDAFNREIWKFLMLPGRQMDAGHADPRHR